MLAACLTLVMAASRTHVAQRAMGGIVSHRDPLCQLPFVLQQLLYWQEGQVSVVFTPEGPAEAPSCMQLW